MAKQTLGDGSSDVTQTSPHAGDPRRSAAVTLATAALGLLGCNACEVYVYDEPADTFTSAACASDGDEIAAGPQLAGAGVDLAFTESSDVFAVDDTRVLNEPLRGAAERLGAVSALVLLASVDRRQLGLIVCSYRWSRHLSAAGEVTPGSFNRVASTALDLARRTEDALDRADRLAALLDSASRFAGELDLEQLFATIHDEVSRHMDAPSFYVALESGASRELRTEYAIDEGVRFHSDALPGREGLAPQVHQSGRPALVEWADVFDASENQQQRAGSVLMVPMRLGERIIGVMAAQSKRPNAYTQHHVEFLLEVAEQAATAIQNAGVLREERRRMAELTMLHRVAVLTSSETQLERVMAAIVVEAASIFHADAASIALEGEHGDYELAATFGLSEAYRKKRRLSGTMLRALYGDPPRERFVGPDQVGSIGQPELIAEEGIRNIFFIPLVYRGKLVGSLALHGRHSIVRLSPGEAHLAQVFADQVAAAMHRAQAAKTLAERIEDLDLVARVGRALVTSLQADYGGVLDILRDSLGYSHLSILAVEGDPPHLRVKAALGYDAAAARGTVVPLDRGLVGLVASSGEVTYVPDVSQEPRYHKTAPEVRSFIAYPLVVEKEVLGVLSVESTKLDAFRARDRHVLAAIADQIAVAMSNARQYAMATERLASLEAARAQAEEYSRYLERRQEEFKLLGAVGAAVNSTLNLNRMLATAAEQIAQGLRVERCVISLYNEEQNESEVVGDLWTAGAVSSVGARFPVRNDSAVLRLLRQRQVFPSVDATQDQRFDGNRLEMLELGFRGCAVAAIASEGQILGTLMVGQTSEPRTFSEEQLSVIETVATQLALGVRNARLYGRARERANEDSLTGLFNHRYLHGRLEQELLRSERTAQPLAVVLFDLNNFKAFNDNYGHQAGDEVLRFMATILHMSLRATDIAGRYGGDEFLVILPQSDEHGAQLLLDRVRRKIEEQAGSGFLPIPIGISAGIAVFPRDGENKRDLIARADSAMYADKRRS